MRVKRRSLWMTVLIALVGPVCLGATDPFPIPQDALVVEIGVEGSPYESLEIGQYGGTMRLRGGVPSSWNPVITMEATVSSACRLFLKGLVSWNPVTGRIYPELARGWEVSEDGLEIVFHLRRGLVWSDGAPFTADDVLFTFNDLHLNEDVISILRGNLRLSNDDFPRIEKLDEHTVRVISPEPYRLLLERFGALILPRHVLAQSVHKLNPDVPPGNFNTTWLADTPPEQLVGIGAFLLESVVPEQGITFRRNPTYYHFDPAGNRLPYLDRLAFYPTEDSDTAFLRFLNGQFDGLEIRGPDTPILMGKAAAKNLTVVMGGVDRITQFLTFNQDCEKPQLRDLFRKLEFRQAVSHAIDREGIADTIWYGQAVPIWSPVWVESPFYAGREAYGGPMTERDAILHDYDLERAAVLLDACGIYDTNGDGWREFEDGTPVRFVLNWNVESTSYTGQALMIADDLAKVGVKVILDAMEYGSLVQRILTGKGFEAVLIGLRVGSDPGTAQPYQPDGELHFWHYSAAEGDAYPYEERIDELLEGALRTFDMDEAFALYKEFQILFAEQDLGVIFTISFMNPFAFYNRFGNAQIFVLSESVWGESVSELVYALDAA